MNFNQKTNEIISRLSRVDVGVAFVDRARVEVAIAEHLRALDLPALPIRWADDAGSGFKAARSAVWSAARSAVWSAARSAAESAVESAARSAAESAVESAARSAAWSAVESAARSAAWSAVESAAESAVESAARSAAWSSPAIDKAVGIWLPFVDAFEAGLWLYWITSTEVIAVPRPALRMKGELLHCEDGPAVYWPTEERYYFLNGVRVTQEIVETPASDLDPRLITKTQNAEERREIVRKVGIERVCQALEARAIDKDGDYELLILNIGDGRHRPYLKMLNPSIGVFHIEGVSPECRTVQQALNFRNGLTPNMIDDKNGAEWIQQGDVLLFPRGETKFQSRPIQLT